MTHNELLAKVKFIESTAKPTEYCEVELCERNLLQLTDALRAVVELHRPQKFYDYNACLGCDNRCGCYEGDIMSYNTWETCPTIKAIEKELV